MEVSSAIYSGKGGGGPVYLVAMLNLCLHS